MKDGSVSSKSNKDISFLMVGIFITGLREGS